MPGHTAAETMDDADIIVINTCAVTGKASGQSRQLIRKAARANKNAAIVVTGCHAQMAAERNQEHGWYLFPSSLHYRQ